MIKYSKNKKLNTLLQNIEKSLKNNLSMDDIKLYYNTFKYYYSDYNIVEYGELFIYYEDIRDFYIKSGYSENTINKMSDYKIWKTYKRQVGYVVRMLLSEV